MHPSFLEDYILEIPMNREIQNYADNKTYIEKGL